MAGPLVDLLHPRGAPAGVQVLGDVGEDWPAACQPGGDHVDVLIIGRQPRGSDRSRVLREALARLSADAIVVLAGDTRDRHELIRPLDAIGLSGLRALFVVDRPGGRRMIGTFDRGAIASAVRDSGSRRADLAAPLAAAAASRLGRLAARMLQTVDVVSRPDAEPLAAWLSVPGDPVTGGSGLLVRGGFQGSAGATVVTRYEGANPVVVGKVGTACGASDIGRREGDALRELGPTAGALGVRLPAALGMADLGGRTAALLSPLEGSSAARLRGSRLDVVLDELADWLLRWGCATRDLTRAAPLVEETVLLPAAALARELGTGAAYVEALRELAGRFGDTLVPLCAAHGDLTLWNVVTDGRGSLGVLDWEDARRIALPGTDLPYLIVDVCTARDRRRDRVAAFRSCFEEGGAGQPRAAALREQASGALGAPAALVELGFHACWLGHAVNEKRRGVKGGDFSRIAALAAKGLVP